MHGVKFEKMVGISRRLLELLQTDAESLFSAQEFAAVWMVFIVAVPSSGTGTPGAKFFDTSEVVVNTTELLEFTRDETLDPVKTVADIEVD